MRLTFHEVLTEISDAAPELREQVFRKHLHNNMALKNLLFTAFSPNWIWDLPEGIPPFKRDTNPPDYANIFLAGEVRRLYVFEKTRGAHVPAVKKEVLFMGMLESLNEYEADVLIRAKEKSITKHYPGITKKLVESVLPEFFVVEKKEKPKKANKKTK
jgi:hypothetical protein